METEAQLINRALKCTICQEQLKDGVRPVFQFSSSARILVAAQAPGRKVHETGIPFNDPSGERLRQWMGIDRDTFYNPELIAILPMGFCFPGTGRSGDLPPRKECAPQWRQLLLDRLTNLQLTLVIGQYAQAWHLDAARTGKKNTVTETVANWREYVPNIYPMPHPSPRNNIWLRRNPWFEQELVPDLQQRIKQILAD
ncbi:MAG: uracil-DNA glycosylase family protein [Amphritea sp.]